MVDFNKLLAKHRATKRMQEEANKVQQVRSQPVRNDDDPPSLYDLSMPRVDMGRLESLMRRHAVATRVQTEKKVEKKPLIEEIKALCIKWGILSCIDNAGTKLSYYESTTNTISPYLLRAHGVSTQTIKDCTVTKTQWKLKITPNGENEEGEDV